MAGAIELFGDGPFAWRIGSLIFGIARDPGDVLRWCAAPGAAAGRRSRAATLMACDNLLLVHGRIGTLDIYTVAMMIWGLALYLRGNPVLAGITLGGRRRLQAGGAVSVAVLVLLEAIRAVSAWRRGGIPASWRWLPAAADALVVTTVIGFAAFIGLLAIMDQIATPYADADAKLITGGPVRPPGPHDHLRRSADEPARADGIASYPWQWLLDMKPITYLRINPSLPGDGLFAIHPVSKFLGVISPPIIAAGAARAGVLRLPVGAPAPGVGARARGDDVGRRRRRRSRRRHGHGPRRHRLGPRGRARRP